MKKIIVFCFIFALSLVSVSAQGKKPKAKSASASRAKTVAKTTPAAPRQGTEVPFVHKTLANGLEVIVLSDASVPVATVEIAARNGSFTEPPELNGLSHLYEHMFFKTNRAILIQICQMAKKSGNSRYYNANDCEAQSKKYAAIGDAGYLNDIGQLGITYNGTTREEVVNYYFSTTSPHIETAVRFIKDAVRYPVFDEDEFAKEKEVVIGEIDRNESNPFFYLSRELSDRMFYKYPTRKNPLGTRETVTNATTRQMRLIQERYYVPNNMALVVTGDVKAEEIFALAEKYFGDWKPRAVEPFKEFPMVEHPPIQKSAGYIVEQPVQNVLIQIGWHGPSIGKDDAATYAADVFSYIISQPDSRFQRNLIDSGLASAIDFTYYTQRNTGPIQLTLMTTPAKAKAALKAVYAEIAQFDKPGYFTDAELENAKTILESRDLFDREKLSEYAHTLSFWWSSTGIEYFRGYHRNLRAVNRAEISRYIKNYVQGKPRIGVALISPESQATAKLTSADLIGN